jgi:hypothetical protein
VRRRNVSRAAQSIRAWWHGSHGNHGCRVSLAPYMEVEVQPTSTLAFWTAAGRFRCKAGWMRDAGSHLSARLQ